MLLRLCPLQDGAVRVTRTRRDAFLPDSREIIVNAVPGACGVTETEAAFFVHCGQTTARVNRQSGAVTFLDSQEMPLLAEDPARPCVMEEKPVLLNRFGDDGSLSCTDSVDGVRASADVCETYEDRKAYECRLSFRFDPEEALYGLGSHEEGYGNLRGRMREMYQHNLKAVVPVLVSTKGWGLLFNLGCMTVFHDDAEGSYLWADCADEMDYYFMAGGYENVMGAYADLTGHAPLLPKYAFGYIQSKERYVDADELISVVREYRRRQVPLDMIMLDWMSWPEGQWGYKTFDKKRFPDPDALTETLHRLGAKMMISVWPSMQGDENADRQEMLEHGYMLGNRTIYNAFLPEARALYWEQAYRGLFRHGVDAWWCDCTEPFESDWHGAIKPEPFQRAALNTAEAKKYLDPGKISLYSLAHSKGMYEGQRKACPEKRVLNLTRSSYAGQHRYAAVTWSGDVSATWETLRRQVPEGLNFMVTGENYWSTDAGGFFPGRGGPWFMAGDFNGGVNDPGFRELYVRWLQLSAFLPIMRSHGTGTPREIWQFGEKGDPWYDAIEAIIRLRSQLVSYLYSLAAAYTDSGMPMVRHPALMFPQDAALRPIDDEMLLGDALLVKPVTRPMFHLPGGRPVDRPDIFETVYLPAGAAWYDGRTAERFEGGQTVRVPAPLDAVPVFLRVGGILPLHPVRQYVEEGNGENDALTVIVCPGANGAFTLYEDAGNGYSYEQGECARTRFIWHDATGELTIEARQGRYPGMAAERELRIRRINGPQAVVRFDGTEITVRLPENE